MINDWAIVSGILQIAVSNKGNFGAGTLTSEQADDLGFSWVGEGYTIASDGRTLVSADGLRQYRPPSFKPRLNRMQANLEWRNTNQGAWQGNAHLDII